MDAKINCLPGSASLDDQITASGAGISSRVHGSLVPENWTFGLGWTWIQIAQIRKRAFQIENLSEAYVMTRWIVCRTEGLKAEQNILPRQARQDPADLFTISHAARLPYPPPLFKLRL